MTDKYGRNFLGVPPQGRADYAFLQHIIKSLNNKKGRCAILFPHGVLFRNEETEMRANLVKNDYVDCVIGLGPNLFYNSPMEACILICQTNKPEKRRKKIQFINAVNDVTRKNAQSYLEDEHIRKIADAYENYSNDGSYSSVVGLDEISKNNYSLSIPLYVKRDSNEIDVDTRTLQEHYDSWFEAAAMMKQSYEKLNALLEKEAEVNE